MTEQAVAHATEVAPLPTQDTSTTALVLDNTAFDKIMAVAEIMAGGRATVPKHLQGNTADCMAIIMQAMQWRMSPFVVAQKTHIVNGTLGYEAQLVNAVASSSGAITGRFSYEYGGEWHEITGQGENRQEQGLYVRVGAVLKGDTEITWGEPLHLIDIKTRNSPLWKTNPKQQLAYLAVKNWTRLYCPDAILGIYSVDELQDSAPVERDMGQAEQVRRRPADIAQAAQRPTAPLTEHQQCLIDDLEVLAKEQGLDALAQAWAALQPADRKAIGASELERLKRIASAVDVPTVDTAEAPHE